MNHRILSPDEERKLFQEFKSAQKSWAEKMMHVGLAAIRVAQTGFEGGNSLTPQIMLRRSFNQEPKIILQNLSTAVPEVYELVYANRALLASADTYARCINHIEKNSEEHAQILLPWNASIQTLENRLQGEEHYTGLTTYASSLEEWKEAHEKHKLPREAFMKLYRSVATELGLPPEEFLELLKDILRYRVLCHEKREQIIAHNQRLVLHYAKKHLWKLEQTYLSVDDIFSIGNNGLAKGVERFNLEKGCKFSTYGSWWIQQAIRREIENTSAAVRIPVHVQEHYMQVNRAIQELQQEHDDETYFPTIDEIISVTGLGEKQIKRALNAGKRNISLDAPIVIYGGKQAYQDSTNVDNNYALFADERQENPADSLNTLLVRNNIDRVLATLTERERKVIELRFGFKDGATKTLEEIGQKYGFTRERIRQIEAKALRKLRHPSKLKLLHANAEDMHR